MPFKSKAQQRKFFAMEAEGKLPKGTAIAWAHETKDIKALPEHVKKSGLLAHAHDSGSGVPKVQLHAGEKVEMEHTDHPAVAKQIAIDHLRERPDYYIRLKKVEGESEKKSCGDMIQYFMDNPKKLKEKQERDRAEKKSATDDIRFADGAKLSNFKLHGERMFKGLDIAIENRKGSKRSWYDPHGKEKGSTFMHFDYGYIRMTKGTDGDHVDVYLGPNEESDKVFLVDQMKKPEGEIKKDGVAWTKFDEQKVMLGFDSAEEAKAAYLKQYNDPRFFGSMKEMPFEEFKMKVLDKDNHGQKIALAVSPTAISHLGHAGVGAGIGAVAGGLGGLMHADPGQRQQGALRGALVGAGLGAAGGAGISALKTQGAHQLNTLRAQAGQAEIAAREAHQIAGKTIADPALAGTMHAGAPPALGRGTLAAKPGAAGGAGGAGGIALNTQQKQVMSPTAWGGSSTPAATMKPELAQSVAASRGGQAEALRQAAGRLEQQHNVMNQGLNRAGLVGAAAGTGLMGYMAVPHQYGGVGPMPGKTASEDPRTGRIADRIDDVGIATLASPYLADAAAGGLKRLMLRGGRMGALAAEGHTVAEGLAHALHHPAVEIGGLGLVAPGITHALAKPIARVTAPKVQEPIVAGQSDMIGNQGSLKAAAELGRALANPDYQVKHSGYGRLALGLGAVGAVGAGLVGAKKGVDAVQHLATATPTPLRYAGVQPGMRPPSPAGM